MALLFEGTLSVEPSCLAVVRFASGVHLSQLRLQETNTNTLELLRHSMPSPAKPYAHMQPFTLQLDSALAPGPQVFDMPQNPEPSRMLLFQGQAWEGVHVKLYGVAQQKKRPAANQITPPDSHTKRVKAEEATPVASSSQGPQHSPISVPDWISIANLLQEHKSKRQQKARSIQQVSVASARTAWPSPASILSTQREQTQLDLISFKDSVHPFRLQPNLLCSTCPAFRYLVLCSRRLTICYALLV